MKDAQEVEDRTDPLANGQRDVITVHPMDQVVNKRRSAGSTKPEERNHGSHSNLFIGQLTDLLDANRLADKLGANNQPPGKKYQKQIRRHADACG